MNFEPPAGWRDIKGFLSDPEAEALFRYGCPAAALGPLLEIGSYCGKSTLCLGMAARRQGGVVYALDHHRGSEEHQPGEMFHDADLYDQGQGRLDTFREFRRNIDVAGLSDWVIPVVAASDRVAGGWTTPLGLVFIDGGHSLDAALTDYRGWAGHILRDGILAIHDIHPDAGKGGQAPYAIYRMALDSGLFEDLERIDTLAVLRRRF